MFATYNLQAIVKSDLLVENTGAPFDRTFHILAVFELTVHILAASERMVQILAVFDHTV